MESFHAQATRRIYFRRSVRGFTGGLFVVDGRQKSHAAAGGQFVARRRSRVIVGFLFRDVRSARRFLDQEHGGVGFTQPGLGRGLRGIGAHAEGAACLEVKPAIFKRADHQFGLKPHGLDA